MLESSLSSPECLAITHTAFCSVCDGDIVSMRDYWFSKGIGTKKGLCPMFCDTWFNLCRNERFVEIGGELSFAFEGDGDTHKLKDFVSNGSSFCSQMNLPVADPHSCYDGTPKSSYLKINKK